MNSTHDNGANGRPADEDLDKLARAYAQLEREEPPELLDMAIRNSAHRAVEKKPRRVKFGWRHGLATAAVFVLALSVIIHQRGNQPVTVEGFRLDQPQPSSVASPLKKQLPESQSGQVRNEFKASAATGKDKEAAGATAAAAEPRGRTLSDAAKENRRDTAAAEAGQAADERIEDDLAVAAKTVQAEEADRQASEKIAEDIGQAEAAKPAIVAAPPPAESGTADDSDMQAEVRLKAIIDMKRNGDEQWKQALRTFIENHPGYPLPDELKD
jgi:hypothetical protein